MEILNLVQGSKEWIERRRKHYSASNAPVMMGEEKYISRLQLKNHYKGWISEVDEFTQKIFDKGHAAEDGARPIVGLKEFLTLEAIVAIETVEGLELLASYDGAELDGCLIEISWEHKLYNQTLYENVRNGVLEAFYYWQLEHQMLVANINKCLFTCSNGTGELMATMTYESVPERREALIKGWIQFDNEMETHEKTAKTLKVEAVMVKSLPELKINVLSEIQSNNLFDYTSAARSYIAKINESLESDQDFEDAKANIKHLKKSEDKIGEVSKSILDGNVDVKNILDELSELKKYSSTKRLNLSKLVTEQTALKKDNLKLNGRVSHQENIDLLMVDTDNLNIGFATPDLDISIKGLSNFDSMKSKIETAVANANIENCTLLEEYNSKKSTFEKMTEDYGFLFSETQQLLLNNMETLVAIVENTISKYKLKIKEDEELRIKKIENRIENLKEVPEKYKNVHHQDVKSKIKMLQSFIVTTEDFEEFTENTKTTKLEVIVELIEMHIDSVWDDAFIELEKYELELSKILVANANEVEKEEPEKDIHIDFDANLTEEKIEHTLHKELVEEAVDHKLDIYQTPIKEIKSTDVITETVSQDPEKESPTGTDIEAFIGIALDWKNPEQEGLINDLGHLLICDDSILNKEAMNNLRNRFKEFMINR